MHLRRADVVWNGGVAVAYFLAAKLGLTLAIVGNGLHTVWTRSAELAAV